MLLILLLSFPFIPFLLAKCDTINENSIYKIIPTITVNLLEHIKNCYTESKWLLCNMAFAKCLHDTVKNEWKYMPVCQESCHSFRATKDCLPVVNFVYEGWKNIAKECPKFTEHGILNCSDYPKSKECQYHIFGKLVFIALLVL